MTISYQVGAGLYLNITNRCPNRCVFCVRNLADAVGDAHTLWLPREPTLREIQADLDGRNLSDYPELTFCGYGEPTQRLETLLAAAAHVKQASPSTPIRLNTNGQANLLAGADITPRLAGVFDAVSVSLNAARAADYEALCRPTYAGAFEAVLDFSRRAARYVPRVAMTVVGGTLPSEDIEACRALAVSCGAAFRVRRPCHEP
ncbi:MAG: TatD family nuclease-associated radical SAM protein [Oscillospiraceae bacterium]|nr:TatD family nuclease-associated radical SAM protein [Oscillospiraceae bacterium]